MANRLHTNVKAYPLSLALHELDGALLREHQVHVPSPVPANHDSHDARRHEGEEHLEAVQDDVPPVRSFVIRAAAGERLHEEPRRQHGHVEAAHPDVHEQQPEVSCGRTPQKNSVSSPGLITCAARTVIVIAHAIVDPGAMVVHLVDASSALATVVRSGRLGRLAVPTALFVPVAAPLALHEARVAPDGQRVLQQQLRGQEAANPQLRGTIWRQELAEVHERDAQDQSVARHDEQRTHEPVVPHGYRVRNPHSRKGV
ncbi:unnamed protein product [Phytophthora lilii]|uniref:Unnamed protein product n=1 Tax=Phytophthora lilii TaxID=2077276 RepID=A0A9W6WQJ2_9STRA|nr:unnamed protein product [Phytophthora lilii]